MEHAIIKKKQDINYTIVLFVCSVIFRPIRRFFTHMATSTLVVKGYKC